MEHEQPCLHPLFFIISSIINLIQKYFIHLYITALLIQSFIHETLVKQCSLGVCVCM